VLSGNIEKRQKTLKRNNSEPHRATRTAISVQNLGFGKVTGLQLICTSDCSSSSSQMLTLWRHCCHIGTAIKHPVSDRGLSRHL